jgi:uncharacterized membrane protein YebE (DUF533 family)
MNKDLKITLGLILVTAVAYHLYKMSQSKEVVSSNQNPAPKQPAPVGEIMPSPSSNFAAYANITADAKSGGFFQSEKVKLNY